MGACCRKLFFTDIYPPFFIQSVLRYASHGSMLPQIVFYRHISPFFYTVSAKVGVTWKDAAANCFLQTYIPLFYTVSAKIGVTWEDAAANCFYVSDIPLFQM